MTGTGAYFYIVWNIWLRYCLNHQQDDYVLVWPAWYILPEVVRNSKLKVNNHANGNINGYTGNGAKKGL